MKILVLWFYNKIKQVLCQGEPSNGNYPSLLESEIPTAPTDQEIEVQKKRIQWIKDNVKFYPTSRTTVYHEGSAYDILMACRQHKLDYQEAPRLFLGAVQWNISYLDMAEMMSNVEQAQTQPPQ